MFVSLLPEPAVFPADNKLFSLFSDTLSSCVSLFSSCIVVLIVSTLSMGVLSTCSSAVLLISVADVVVSVINRQKTSIGIIIFELII